MGNALGRQDKMNNTQRHIDELYKTGKTTFRDNLGAYPDYVVKFNDLVASWALVNVESIATGLKKKNKFLLFTTFDVHVQYEIKQLCIDYYDEP
jgi:hypothetical protein